jgi:hypothetical protein
MWPFKKSAQPQDERENMLAIQLDFPTKGINQEAVELEARKKLKLFIAEALTRFGARGLRHYKTVFTTDGHGAVMFVLPKSDPHTVEISQELGDLWHRFSGW